MSRVIADGLSKRGATNLDEVDAKELYKDGEAAATEGYSDTQASNAESNANNYTDTQINGLDPMASSGSYNDLKNVPSEFTPEDHNHTLGDVTDSGTIASEDRVSDGGRVPTIGTTESVTLSNNTLTIPAGQSTVKLPSSVWDGSSNITISGFAFENGVQPEPGYEFALVIPRTGVASAGTLGNDVLLQHGASLQVSANGFADLPCYPNAADNPDQDAVQYAAPYYRLKMRVEEYDGSGDPVVSVEELPDPVKITNDVGISVRWAGNYQTSDDKFDITNYKGGAVMTASGYSYSAAFSGAPNIIVEPSDFAEGTTADDRDLISVGANPASGTVDGNGARLVALLHKGASSSFTSGDALTVNVRSRGEWY